MKVRAGQREFERGVERHRIAGLLARRQYGKTTIAARIAIRKMLAAPGHTVVFGSLKLDLGREIVSKEASILQQAIQTFGGTSTLGVYDAGNGRDVTKLRPDDFAEVYEAQRLEFRLYHSRAIYSRTKVVALTPDAVGETGDLILDEVGRVRNFREVWEAVKPIISSNPKFRCVLTTTPPPDDTHYSFELLAPPIGDDAFKPIPTGNWYRSELGVHVLRIDAWDAYADGIPLYDDDTGAEQSPEESRASDPDKEAWDRNYGCRFVLGGSGAVSVMGLHSAQERGVGQCAYARLGSTADAHEAVDTLLRCVGYGPIGCGYDIATTNKGVSNPSAFAYCERRGVELVFPLIVTWKTADPQQALDYISLLLSAVRIRDDGGPVRKLCVDSTNERYFAAEVRRIFARECPVDLVVASESIQRAGHEPMSYKEWLGSQLCAEIEDNRVTLPPERYIREDFRLVRRERGLFVCTPDVDGKHGDTFDAAKLAIHALSSGNPGRFLPPSVTGRRARALSARTVRVLRG